MAKRVLHRKQAAREEQRAAQRREARRGKLLRVLPLAGVVVLLVAGGTVWAMNYKSYPPSSFNGQPHAETFPPQKIMSEPIPDGVQIHVMEHGAGEGSPSGVIVSYNCVKFTCEPDLVANLTRVVEAAGRGIYLAPYPRMDAKIALATNGKLETLDAFDEDRINRFIRASVNR